MDENRPQFPVLQLIREDVHEERRRPPGRGPTPPERGGRAFFSGRLTAAVDRVEAAAQERKRPPGIVPHLIFKLPLAHGANVDQIADSLQDAGIRVVSVDPGDVIVAFADEANLSGFRSIVARYAAGPVTKLDGTQYASTSADFVEFIEADELKPLSGEDRLGARLKSALGDNLGNLHSTAQYVVDVELWHRGTRNLLDASRAEVQAMLDATDATARITDHYFGRSIALLKIVCNGNALSQLLELDVVAGVDLPPSVRYDLRELRLAVPSDFPTPPEPEPNGPRLCVIDSGIASNHPLLASNVGDNRSFLSATTSAADGYGHGTGVASIAVFGDVHACINAKLFSSPIRLYGARVLNDDGQFDPEKLIVNIVAEAIRFFAGAPYNCRVFNLSLYDPDYVEDPQRQSVWAENLDVLSRELKVLLVVSAGNRFLHTGYADKAEKTLLSYPAMLLDGDNHLVDPASASVCVTVGAIADEGLARSTIMHSSDIRRPVALDGQMSPFSRIGPGLKGAIKPEFLEVGGNHVFEGTGGTRSIRDDGVLMFSHLPFTSGLFTAAPGTSFAAPRLARTVALIEHRLRGDMRADPHPNLLRAMLAQASFYPDRLVQQLESPELSESRWEIAGYGMCNTAFSATSTAQRVVMVYQGAIAIDRFQVFEVPIPNEFWRASGEKRIRVSLAYDPPVNRRQRRYFGTEVVFNVYRGVDLATLVEALKRQPREALADEVDVPPDDLAQGEADSDSNGVRMPRLDLRPKFKARSINTLQLAEKIYQRRMTNRDDDPFWLVVRCDRKWNAIEVDTQDYAVALTLEANEPRLFDLVRARIRARERVRARTSR